MRRGGGLASVGDARLRARSAGGGRPRTPYGLLAPPLSRAGRPHGTDRDAYAFESQGEATPDSDELDEATGPPVLAKTGLRWQDDPEHAQAVADVVARANGNIDKFGLQAGRTARLKQQAADIINELKGVPHQLYPDDQPAKVREHAAE